MKPNCFFRYLFYGALAAFFSFLQKVFAALSKKCFALLRRAERLPEITRQKIERLKEKQRACLEKDESVVAFTL